MSYDYDVERRLVAWAYYEFEMSGGFIGWPEKSIICQFAEGYLSPRYAAIGSCPLLKYEIAQQMATWIALMRRKMPDHAEAIIFYYLTRRKIRDIADFLGIPTSTLKQRLREARIWLNGLISASKDS